MTLSEKHRPVTFDDVVGQDKAIARIQTVRARGWGGRAYYLIGQSGIGKTTIARIIASGANPQDIREVIGRQLTPADLLEMRRRWSYIPLGVGHALIVNEAHSITRPVIELFLDILEGLPERIVIIFTTTKQGNDLFEEKIDSGPFGSRCVSVTLTNQGLCPCFAKLAKKIASQEGLDGQPIEAYRRLAKKSGNNLRTMLTSIEAGEMRGETY